MLGEISPKISSHTFYPWYYPSSKNDGTVTIVNAFPYTMGGVVTASAFANVALTTGKTYAFPWFIPNDICILDVGVVLQSAVANSTIRVGVYADMPKLSFPGRLIQEFGLLASSATIDGNQSQGVYFFGSGTSTPSLLNAPVVLRAGYYWAGFLGQGTGGVHPECGFVPTAGIGMATVANATLWNTCYIDSGTIASPNPMPDPYPGSTSGPTRNGSSIPCPALYLRLR